MLSPRWRKVLRDLWNYKGRTALVVLSIAVGVFAVGAILTSRVILSEEMTRSWQAINPASGTLYTDLFDQELVWTVRNLPQVQEADARRNFRVRFQTAADAAQEPANPSSWRNLSLYTYLDYDDIRIFKLWPVSGAYPPPEHEILLERGSLDWMGVQLGDRILLEGLEGRQRWLRIAGIVHDQTQTAASWMNQAYGYVTPETMAWLGISRGFDELLFAVREHPEDEAHIKVVAQEVRDKVERSGRTVYYTWIETPGRHPAENDIDPIMVVLALLGMLSLIASGFLVVNTLQALLSQQVRQIGVMKAIGAAGSQVLGIYYAMVLLFGLLALALAVPLGALGALGLTRYIAGVVNFDIASFVVPTHVLVVEITIGLVVPLLAALYPILSGTRVSVRRAISDYGIGNGQFGQGRIDRLLERVRGLPRPLVLSVRNTFRRKARLALTLSTLTLAGGLFVAVFSTQSSLERTIQEMFDYIQYDVVVSFERSYRTDQVAEQALNVPGVVAVESWNFNGARRVRPDGLESDPLSVRASPPGTALIQPTILEGRWLLPEDQNAVVVNTMFLDQEPDIAVGSDIVLKLDGEETTWRVVGVAGRTPPMPTIFMNSSHLALILGELGRSTNLIVVTDRHDPASQAEVAQALESHLERSGIRVGSTMTSSAERGQIMSQLNVLVVFLLIMAVLLAVVGGIGLMGTMSLNVMERTREIGVLRAIGASTPALLRIIVVEGILIGLISWLLGAALAAPLGMLLSQAVGVSVLDITLSYSYSVLALGLWLAIILILATLASLWPARNAAHCSVRQALAYE